MPYSKQDIESYLEDIARRISITDDLFDDANNEYKALGSWINKKSEEEKTDYQVLIYPQGSFALGTVIRPISDDDDYDLDLVCEIENGTRLLAKQLKVDVVKPWLVTYKKHSTDIEEKRRCWHIDYDDLPSFHMDVIPSIPFSFAEEVINITDKDEEKNSYSYQRSNPKGYVAWFLNVCKKRKETALNERERLLVLSSTEQEKLEDKRMKYPLQKAVQILKRHRDVMFKDDENNTKPISIIITTLCGQVYDGETTIFDTIEGFLERVESFLNRNRAGGHYFISNPSMPEENFADKWIKHPERQRAFFDWLNRLKADFNYDRLSRLDRVGFGKEIQKSFGTKTGTYIITQRGKSEANAVLNQELKVDTKTGNLSKTGSITVPPSHHYGET